MVDEAGQSTARPSGLANLRPPWQPGQSGNPGGQAKGLAKMVREGTHDGADLIEFYLGIFTNLRTKRADRFEAAAWLADRGWGKATVIADTTLHAGESFEALVLAMAEVQRRLEG